MLNEEYTDKQKKQIAKVTEKIWDAFSGKDLEVVMSALNICLTQAVSVASNNEEGAHKILDDMVNRTKDTLKTMSAMGMLNWKNKPTMN